MERPAPQDRGDGRVGVAGVYHQDDFGGDLDGSIGLSRSSEYLLDIVIRVECGSWGLEKCS